MLPTPLTTVLEWLSSQSMVRHFESIVIVVVQGLSPRMTISLLFFKAMNFISDRMYLDGLDKRMLITADLLKPNKESHIFV